MTDSIPLYPLALEPSLHVKVWGGRKLQDRMGKSLPADDPYGEAWELHDTATIANGPLAGRTLGDVLVEYGAALVGPDANPTEGFPLLVKLLDASDWLSVQVHPDDRQAALLEGQPRGKTEAWYVLAADPGARLVIGVDPGTDRQTMARAIRENTLADLLVVVDVKADDALYMPAGTVHAIGPGILIYEVQQASDTTYRLYDWGRTGLDGVPRELHIEKGVQVSNTSSLPVVEHFATTTDAQTTVIRGEYFRTVLHRLSTRDPLVTLDTNGDTFHVLTCIEGAARLEAGDTAVNLNMGKTVLVPASVGAFTLAGDGRVLRSWQQRRS